MISKIYEAFFYPKNRHSIPKILKFKSNIRLLILQKQEAENALE